MTRALEPVWEPIQAALDARRDPLDDPRVAEFLAERPDAAREYAELVLVLERVGGVPTERAPSVRSRARVAAAAVLLALLGALALFLARGAQREPARVVDAPATRALEPRAETAAANAFGVTHYRIERVRTTPNGREVVVLEDGRVARSTTTTSAQDALAVTIERTTWAPRGQEFQ